MKEHILMFSITLVGAILGKYAERYSLLKLQLQI